MKKNSFIEGTVISTLAIVFVKILGMLYVIPFYAMIGSEAGALYAYAYTIYNICLDISTAGIPLALSKLINEYNTKEMYEAKVRTYRIGRNFLLVLAIIIFAIVMIGANYIASILLGDLQGGNTINDVALVVRFISLAILVIPLLSVQKGYLQGHKMFSVPSMSQVIEQVVRILFILLGSYIVLNFLHLSSKVAVCIALLGAFFGGIVAYLYILVKMNKSKESLELIEYKNKDNVTNKEIVKRIFSYALPFIIINAISSLYNFVDMTLILRTMNYLHINAKEAEYAATVISTWAPKINMVISSMAMGLTVSLIPTIVTAFTLNDFKEVNNKFNQALQVILFISLPMAFGIAVLSRPIWSIFYGSYNTSGPIILRMSVISCLMGCLYMVASSTMQGLNKFKLVYTSTIIGFFLNMFLDAPLILLFNKIGIPLYLGAVTASIIGYSTSFFISVLTMKKQHNLSYKNTLQMLRRLFIPLVLMAIVVLGLNKLIIINLESKTSCVLYVGFIALIGSFIYFFLSYKLEIINDIFGKDFVSKIIKKLTRKGKKK